ncbi:MBL fold metallo-hydrolase [Aquibacillus sp. 3ASR75-11]|uniref:MBL fold metallo-hydrolase n=1 Tax=Terrihalobacillus insolitus TaxID=2950438 RepID=A0A9X3WU50_9BACI|nr:MBL fold metallo-hydrolase [Terrihalobacillus insolitus]MDC3411872.1 MBL fold metallo-hydrolase [Terrihalobacillus insolitus]MDC3423449.1 MBL fold metallo-hydrolase [Terrihalobacillus insolitus]
MDLLEEYGLKLIKLDLPFRLNHVNCFLAEGEDGWTVIDAGLHNHETVQRWEKELEGKNVTEILITHYHPDHFGYAGQMQRKTSAKVSMTKTDYDMGLTAWQGDFLRKLKDHYKLSGIPTDQAEQMIRNTEEFVPRVTPYPKVDHFLEEGDLVQIGRYEYEVIFTPGHADGLVSFYNRKKNMLLSTDHILPKITPNISYWFHGDPNPLKTYLRSLEKIRKLNVDLVVPSHGRPFHGANDRIDEIRAHHEERLDMTLEILRDGGTIYGICRKLFRQKLNVHESRFAIGETISHLEYLRNQGACKREVLDGEYWYFTS